MFSARKFLFAWLVGGALGLSAGPANAQKSDQVRQVEREYTSLKSRLDQLNREIGGLKAHDRSLRDEYRLRARMAEAESLAKQVTAKEGQLRDLGGKISTDKADVPSAPPPHATADDNPIELEAKADLLADQSARMDAEAGRFEKAALELRRRQGMRRQVAKWDRDPFLAFEASKRSLATQPAKGTPGLASNQAPTKAIDAVAGAPSAPPTNENSTAGDTSAIPPRSATSPSGPAFNAPALTPPTTTLAGGASASATSKAPSVTVLSDGTTRVSYESRVFLDPATAAGVRGALRSDGAYSDPAALMRASEVLREKARGLAKEADALRKRSQGR